MLAVGVSLGLLASFLGGVVVGFLMGRSIKRELLEALEAIDGKIDELKQRVKQV